MLKRVTFINGYNYNCDTTLLGLLLLLTQNCEKQPRNQDSVDKHIMRAWQVSLVTI